MLILINFLYLVTKAMLDKIPQIVEKTHPHYKVEWCGLDFSFSDCEDHIEKDFTHWFNLNGVEGCHQTGLQCLHGTRYVYRCRLNTIIILFKPYIHSTQFIIDTKWESSVVLTMSGLTELPAIKLVFGNNEERDYYMYTRYI